MTTILVTDILSIACAGAMMLGQVPGPPRVGHEPCRAAVDRRGEAVTVAEPGTLNAAC